ncbi:MAG: hypothetical protein HYY44_05740 [Deltaproteobacteria bacterium]|nr:hypothetical protein [Deltaproteobacteria bacterium]
MNALLKDLPEEIALFIERQLGPGATPGWPYEVTQIESKEGYHTDDGIRYQNVTIRLADDARQSELCYTLNGRKILRWSCERSAEEKGPLTLTQEEALERLKNSIELPEVDLAPTVTRFVGKFEETLLSVDFNRQFKGVEVAGDYVTATVNRTTGRISRYYRTPWLPLPEFPREISREEAKRAADLWIESHRPDARPASLEPKRIIEFFDPEKPASGEELHCEFVYGHHRCWNFQYQERTTET